MEEEEEDHGLSPPFARSLALTTRLFGGVSAQREEEPTGLLVCLLSLLPAGCFEKHLGSKHG